MKKKIKIISPERAASLIPILISSIFVFMISYFFSLPKYFESNKVNIELEEFTRKKNQLPNLKDQYRIINEKLKNLNLEKTKIIELISGTSNLETFLDKLGYLANKNNVDFVSIIPSSIVMFEKSNNQNEQVQDKNINDPLLVEGIKKYVLNVSFKATYKNLLSFLRDLEFQENIILFKDININLIKGNNEDSAKKDGYLQIKLNMFVYGKI